MAEMNAPVAPLSPYSSALGKENIETHTLSAAWWGYSRAAAIISIV
jgi:hypothetical protein